MCVCLCECLLLKLLITSGMMWMSYDWLNKFCSCYMATVVVIVNGHGLGIVRVVDTNPILLLLLVLLCRTLKEYKAQLNIQ